MYEFHAYSLHFDEVKAIAVAVDLAGRRHLRREDEV
jgi:hypothetical protein